MLPLSGQTSQWSAGTAGTIYYNGGDVGIGTSTPAVREEIDNLGTPYNLYLSGFAPSLYLGAATGVMPNGGAGQTSAGLLAFATANGSYGMLSGDMIMGTQSWQAGNSNAIRFVTPGNNSGAYSLDMSILKNGNVAIGTSTSAVKTEIDNQGVPYNLYLSGFAPNLYFGAASGVMPNGGAGQTAAAYLALATSSGSYGMSTGDFILGTQSWQTGNSNAIRFVTPQNDSGSYTVAMSILRSGNVGIGTLQPTYPLSVNGAIQAKEVIVSTGWSDYVFDDEYALLPLPEIAAFIHKNHHLPNVPSQAEVEQKGVPVGEMESKLLAKIEELTLHMIRMSEDNRQLRERLERLEKR